MGSEIVFHNYHSLISSQKRTFKLYKPVEGSRNIDTRWSHGSLQSSKTCSGVWNPVTDKDLSLHPDMQLEIGDLKIITTPNLMNGVVPALNDIIFYDNREYFIHQIINQNYYGNYYKIYLKQKQFNR